jgi:hypothetical protein
LNYKEILEPKVDNILKGLLKKSNYSTSKDIEGDKDTY